MSDQKNYFLLLRENEGKIKKGGYLTRNRDDEYFTALTGSLYKERSGKTTKNTSILCLVSLANDDYFLDVTYNNALKLNEKELQFLLTLRTDMERYEMGYLDRNHLESALKAKVEDVVFIDIGNGIKQHCLIHEIKTSKVVGKLYGRYFILQGDKIPPGKQFRFDEIETFVPDVESDIPENNKCKEIEKLVCFDKVTFDKEKIIPKDFDKNLTQDDNINVGSRVMVPIKNRYTDKIEYKPGKVKLLYCKSTHEILCGVELDDSISSSIGNYLEGKKLFDCKLYHGIIVDIDEVIPIEAYHPPDEDKKVNTLNKGIDAKSGNPPKNCDFNFNDASLYGEKRHTSPAQHNELSKVSNVENEFDIGSMVQFQVRSSVVTGCIKWIGFIKVFGDKKMAGVELNKDQLSIGNCNGSIQGEIYFSCRPGRGIFLPLTKLKKDSRFEDNNTSNHCQVMGAQNNLNIVIECQPYITNVHELIGKWRGIQGHLNSCYMDATLFAMFACSDVFDSALYDAKVPYESDRYNKVREVLKNEIVNPLRKNKYISEKNIQELRHHLDAANETNMGDEQDVEEFVNLILDKILGFPPFIKIWSEKNNSTFSTHLHQMFVSDFESQPLPSVQYLLDKSFLEGDMYLENVPDIMILHMPRNAKEKIFPKIQVTSTVDLSSILKGARQWCVFCQNPAEFYCFQCSSLFGKENIYPFLCISCLNVSHTHQSRKHHSRASVRRIPPPIGNDQQQQQHENRNKMELFAVLCIELNHYVSFVRCNDSWVFFDSMADRIGEKDGYNIPSVQEVGNLDAFLDAPPLRIANLKDPKKMNHTARFFEDVYMCFYRRIVEPNIYANNFHGNSNIYENMQNIT